MTDGIGQRLGNYRLLRLLGQGAFAEVYLGEHQYLERPAAIKVLHQRMEAAQQESFRREARTIARLQHPHIIGVHDFGIENQTPYLVMEYLAGGTLRQQHPKGTHLAFEHIVRYVKPLASALDYAHAQQVIHRDIKPENILLTTKHEVILSDFGIAVVQQTQGFLSTQNSAGTPLYMAPEQIQRHPCPASDQYALGVMIYEWLTGEPPFRGSLYEVFSQHLHQPPPRLRARLPELPAAVEDAVFGALAKDPGQRFASVADFATVLEEAFFATQPLSLRMSVASAEQEESPRPLASAIAVPASSLSDQEHSDALTPPRLGTGVRMPRDLERGHDVSSHPVVQSQKTSRPTLPSMTQANRERLLRRVRSFWITGVLEQSLHGAALLALGLHEHPDAVANPWHLVLHHPHTSPRPLPTGTRITQVYDEADGELLILGAPGCGKTTLLLELARDLLSRAEREEQHPLPIIFTLSSWAMKQASLVDWLVEELVSKYQVPRKLGQALVDADQVLPLLDGLDEVAPTSRMACIEMINTYREEHGWLPFVVCSRSVDYLAQTARLQLGHAVAVQPLTEPQVDDYLASGGEAFWALRQALRQDAELRELTSTPLMLSILMLAYDNMPGEDLLREASQASRQRQIFEGYVERMLTRRRIDPHFSMQKTIGWLAWLARQMKRQNQTQFSLEQLQPAWIEDRRAGMLYRCVLLGSPVGLFSLLFAWLFALQYAPHFLLAVVIGLLLGGLLGLVTGLFKRTIEIRPVEALTWSWRHIKQGFVIGTLVGVVIAFVIGWTSWLSNGTVSIGTSIGYIFYLAHVNFKEIPSWIIHAPFSWLFDAIVNGLLVALSVGFLVALLRGPSGATLEEQHRFRPNQGIWRSARNAGIFALMSLPVVVLLAITFLLTGGAGWGGLGPLPPTPLLVTIWMYFTALTALVVVLLLPLIVLRIGGAAALQHLVLRVFLWRCGLIPWNYPRFLDDSAECILLRKVGGGYIFVHRLLLEYFAALGTAPLPPAAKARK